MDFNILFVGFGVPLVRGIAGWIENAFDDGEVSSLEWSQLGGTVVRIGIISLGLFYGLDGLGLDVSALGASAGAVVIDFILKAFKKK